MKDWTFNNAEVGILIKEYYEQSILGDFEGKGVVEISFEQSLDTTILIISTELQQNFKNRHDIPSHYFFADSVPVVVKTELGSVFTFDSSYVRKMKEDLYPYYEPYEYVEDTGDTLLDMGITYLPRIWEIKILEGKIIEKKKFNEF
jgi:hypothetical protein